MESWAAATGWKVAVSAAAAGSKDIGSGKAASGEVGSE
jgi:hypothetical protein